MTAQDYIEPTPAGRAKLLAGLLLLAVGGTLWHFHAFPALKAHMSSLPTCEQYAVMILFMKAVVLGVAPAVSALGLWMAARMLRLRQFPLPGTWVLRRTPVRRGAMVMLRAYALLVLCVLLLMGAGWTWSLIQAMPAPDQCHPMTTAEQGRP